MDFSSLTSKIRRYWPLFSLVLIAFLASSALHKNAAISHLSWMSTFMGIFLCQFAMLKIFHPKGFVEGFQKYDLIASQSKIYGYLYPLIELALGLGYLAGVLPILVNLVTIVVFGIGVVGVVQALRKGLDVRCACLGTVIDIPLSTVTLTEDIAMIAMAFISLVH